MSKAGVLLWRKIFESGDAKRIAKQHPDVSMLEMNKDIPYLNDGDQGHLFDIYRRKDGSRKDPVMINIHGGGLFASYKEVNAHFNYEIAKMGYTVVSLSYRRIPETTLLHQIDDIMNAFSYIETHGEELGLNLDELYISGDSAGALLALFGLAITSSPQLQKAFEVRGNTLKFRSAAFISIMLNTQRKDLLFSISNVVTDKNDKGKPYEKYLLNPSLLLEDAQLPAVIQFTSDEDLIQKDSLQFYRLLEEKKCEHTLYNYPKGTERQLPHVFAVMYPDYPESREVYARIDSYLRHGKVEKHRKFFVWNIDDGLEQDKRIIEILRKYHMGATFNLNSGLFGYRDYEGRIGNMGMTEMALDKYESKKRHLLPYTPHFRIPENEVKEVYEGFEIASHTLEHKNLKKCDRRELEHQIMDDVNNLARKFNQKIVGFAYPFGVSSGESVEVLKKAGIRYARSVSMDKSYRFPKDPYMMPMNGWHITADVFDRLEDFISMPATDDDLFFLMFAHGYEFDFNTRESNWEKFEKICQMVSEHDDIICCSTGEAFRMHEQGEY